MKLVILFSGKISSGKNTAAEILKEELEKLYSKPVQSDYFARALKELCRDSFKPLTDFFNEMMLNLLKEKYLDSYSFNDIKNLITHDYSWFEIKNPITRHILQIIGTDIVRGIDQNYWTKKTIENIHNSKENIFLITDTRFFNEMDLVGKEFNTIEIRINRNIDRNNSFNEHVSETALDDYKDWDIVINNDGTLEDLRKEIQIIVKDRMFSKPINEFNK